MTTENKTPLTGSSCTKILILAALIASTSSMASALDCTQVSPNIGADGQFVAAATNGECSGGGGGSSEPITPLYPPPYDLTPNQCALFDYNKNCLIDFSDISQVVDNFSVAAPAPDGTVTDIDELLFVEDCFRHGIVTCERPDPTCDYSAHEAEIAGLSAELAAAQKLIESLKKQNSSLRRACLSDGVTVSKKKQKGGTGKKDSNQTKVSADNNQFPSQ